MSGSHEKLPKLFWIQIILVLIVGTLFLLAPKSDKHQTDGDSESNMKSAAEILAPVGVVETKSEMTAGGAKARSGEAVYNETCQTCHDAGIANAPKLDDKAAWEPRVANGLDGLLKTAINGKGAMPARGGNPAITDAEMKAVVLYMAVKAGFDLEAPAAAPGTQTETKAPEVAETPKAPEAPKAAEVPAPPAAPVAPAAEAAVAAAPMTATAPADTAVGEKVYKNACFACHDTGVAGSPKIGDAAAWTARIAAGTDALYNSAINGKGVMPPKGGNMGLSDTDVKAAVDYMAANSQ